MNNKPNVIVAFLYAIVGYFLFNIAYSLINIVIVSAAMLLSKFPIVGSLFGIILLGGKIQAFLFAIAAAYISINLVYFAIQAISKYGSSTNFLAIRITGIATLIFQVYQAMQSYAVGGVILPNVVAAIASIFMILEL